MHQAESSSSLSCLWTGRLLPLAFHPASRRRSYLPLRRGQCSRPIGTFTLLLVRTLRRTSHGPFGACRVYPGLLNCFLELVPGMWRILQSDNPDDYVLATNETHTVKEFVEKAFAHVDLDWREFVRHDKRYERPAEVDLLIGNPAKAKKILGWEPKVRFDELIQIMGDADLMLAEKGAGRVELTRL